MSEREPIGKKLRFEVLKRDSFTCQYCGRKAPDVVLQIDHVKPVVEGGATDILNLVTSCWECNSGKGGRQLTDHQLLNQARDQMAELEERRQQIEMMIQWQDELRNLDVDGLARLEKKVAERGGFTVTETGRAKLRQWQKRHELPLLLRAVDESFDTYLKFTGEQVVSESWEKAFSKIPAVARVLSQEDEKPYLRRVLFIQAIIRNRDGRKHFDCAKYLEHIVLCGGDIDEMERRSKRIRNFAEFEEHYDAWLKSIGEPF